MQVNFFKYEYIYIYIGTARKIFLADRNGRTSFPETSKPIYQRRHFIYQNTWSLSMKNLECRIVVLISYIARVYPSSVNDTALLNRLQFLLDFLWWYFFIYTLVCQFNPVAPIILKIRISKVSSNFIPIFPARNSALQAQVCTFERHLSRSGRAADSLKFVLHKISLHKNRSSSKNSCKLWKRKKFKNNCFFLKQTK